ncbi:MAG TPA: hypothetical protein PLO37_12165 [Candidatus Hydrogenedentes bacterium]|nr:hypothetical protein [Candidatus Hydrogenedentota bacterium]HPG67597.1 hypothetical protein [Candidatus Hydrogenedentota bacterium]
MAYGDIGGAVTELVITCQTPASGAVSIAKGDAVKLTGAYTVSNDTSDEDPVFGQALAAATENGAAIPVKVRGICVFAYAGETAPTVNGAAGVLASATNGEVKAPASGHGVGINVKVDTGATLVHVLL